MTYVIFFTIQFNQDCFSSHFVKNLAINGKKNVMKNGMYVHFT